MLQPLVASGIRARALGAALLLAACASPAIPDDSGVTEDFESYTTGQVPTGHWTVETEGGAVTVDDTRAVSGTRAARSFPLAARELAGCRFSLRRPRRVMCTGH